MIAAFLNGVWLGGALCYGAILVIGGTRMRLLDVVLLSLLWPFAIAMVLAVMAEERK